MSQTTLDDDALFDEAASEMRQDVEEALAAARRELPSSKEIWELDSENALGVLNGLKSALDIGEATDHLQEAKKWYTMGTRAEAFEDASDIASEIEDLENLLSHISNAHELSNELASTLPELRNQLDTSSDEEAA